jgi:hypothetical protein
MRRTCSHIDFSDLESCLLLWRVTHNPLNVASIGKSCCVCLEYPVTQHVRERRFGLQCGSYVHLNDVIRVFESITVQGLLAGPPDACGQAGD